MQKAAICAIVKDEGRYIREWIAYHFAIGFDHFYIFDNESTDDTREALDAAARAGICSVETWPNILGARAQLQAYKTGLSLAKEKAEWLLFLDADEFVNLKRHRGIKAFLEDYPEADAIGLNWRMFGSAGETTYRPGLVMERFTMAAPESFGPNHLIKTIARTSALIEPNVHTHRLREGSVFINSERQALAHFPRGRQDVASLQTVQVNHYFSKTYEEWSLKKARGKADFPPDSPERIRSDGEFHHNDRNDVRDDSILLWKDLTLRNVLRVFNHI